KRSQPLGRDIGGQYLEHVRKWLAFQERPLVVKQLVEYWERKFHGIAAIVGCDLLTISRRAICAAHVREAPPYRGRIEPWILLAQRAHHRPPVEVGGVVVAHTAPGQRASLDPIGAACR